MRKLSFVFLSLALAALHVPAGATSAPFTYASFDQIAEADWIVMDGPRSATWYFGGGIRMADAGTAKMGLYGFVGKGDCEVRQEKNLMEISCSAQARLREVTSRQFDIDPALRSARLRLSQFGMKHSINWKAIGPAPFADGGVSGGDGFAMAAAYVSRPARAKGTVFRHNFSGPGRSGLNFAFMTEGAIVAAFSDYGRTVEVVGDRVVLSVHLRVAR